MKRIIIFLAGYTRIRVGKHNVCVGKVPLIYGISATYLWDKCHLSLGKVPLISGISATYL